VRLHCQRGHCSRTPACPQPEASPRVLVSPHAPGATNGQGCGNVRAMAAIAAWSLSATPVSGGPDQDLSRGVGRIGRSAVSCDALRAAASSLPKRRAARRAAWYTPAPCIS
jgi:hypothetical protein